MLPKTPNLSEREIQDLIIEYLRTMNTYLLKTQKTWSPTMRELEEQMRLWSVTDWDTNYPRGARSEAWEQSEADRTGKLTSITNGKPVTLQMGQQNWAVDNLRVLYLAIEAVRLNEKRGITDIMESA
jgi:hypothetical protein